MGFKLWEDLLLGRFLPSISSTITAFIVVLLVIEIFRVRSPGTKHLLLHLPLAKGLLVLIRGIPAPVPGFETQFRYGFQLYDPFSFLNIPDIVVRDKSRLFFFYDNPSWDSALAQVAFFMAIGAAVGILIYRWIGLTLYYRALLARPAAPRAEAPDLYRLLDRLVIAFKVTYPRVILMGEPALAPCTVGIRPPTIVLPKRLLKELDELELEGVLAHELAHVKRGDGLWHWATMLLRDLQPFNPLVHRLFDRLLVEREKDADLRAAKATGRPKDLARALVDVSLWARGVELRPAPGAMTLRKQLMGGATTVEERVQLLLEGPIVASRLRPVGLILLMAFLFLLRIYVHFPVFGHVVMLE